ncbi:MAG: HAMP domain-containing histidine kinase [Chloroflexi bacterium]|nr:HAMP domain-containing histidine kinase [Chloroflexota bacterium]MCC6896749.1 HAMP domain-containing histidine kinase [Anaerolineae bacterium]
MVVADSDVRPEPIVSYSDAVAHNESDKADDSVLLKKLLQVSRDLVSIYDLETEQIVYKNRSLGMVLGYTTYGGQVDEKTVFQVLLHPDDVVVFADQLAAMRLAADNVVKEITYRLQHSSGLWRLFAEQQTVFKRRSDGTPWQILRIARDITEQHDSAQRLQADNALKIEELQQAADKLTLEREKMQLVSKFIGTTAHELRTPLTIINTSLYLLKKMSDPLKQAERLQIIENQVAQLSRLISQMHLLMRLDSLSQLAEIKPLSINTLLTKLEQEFGGLLAKKELILQLDFADNLPNVYGDMDLIMAALRNVLENAVLYTDVGTIKAQTARYENKLVFSVSDTGIGVRAEDLDHIFERFYKMEKDKRSNRIAAGLGLAITRRIMELHGGEVIAESQLGVGSTFHLIWPV